MKRLMSLLLMLCLLIPCLSPRAGGHPEADSDD